MCGIKLLTIILIIILIVFLLVLLYGTYLKKIRWLNKLISLLRGSKPLFVIQAVLFIISLVFSADWFLCGSELIPLSPRAKSVLERGSFSAIGEIAKALGLSSILFGWLYTERERLTLGVGQLDLIEYKFGKHYNWSVFIHFGSTILCMLMSNVVAKEAALAAFFSLLFGFCAQIAVCSCVALNKKGRERIALEFWERGGGELSLDNMIEHFGDDDVKLYGKYQETLCRKMADWIFDSIRVKTNVNDLQKIESISRNLRAVIEKVPDQEKARFSERFLSSVCERIESKKDPSGKDGDWQTAAKLLCGGYFRYLCGLVEFSRTQDSCQIERRMESLTEKIYSITYFSSGDFYKSFLVLLKRFFAGFGWYLFLDKKIGISCSTEYLNLQFPASPVDLQNAESYFKSTVRSILDGRAEEDFLEIAWKQV